MTKKTHGQKTKEKILKAGLLCWPKVTLEGVAQAAKMESHNAVLYHFPGGTLRDAVAKYAVETGCSKVIVQLIGSGHPAVLDLSPTDRNLHFKAMH
jgi:uncharacterized protein YjdB